MYNLIISLIAIASLAISGWMTPQLLKTQNELNEANSNISVLESNQLNLAGAINPVASEVYYLSGAALSSSATSIGLTKFGYTQPNGVYSKFSMPNFGDKGCITIQPGNTSGKQEFASFTGLTQNSDGTATLSGVSRGLERYEPFSASTTLQTAHAGGSQVVVSNSPPCFYENYTASTQDETITGQWTFSDLPESSLVATTSSQFTNKAYVDATANAGAATSTETNGGIVELATQLEMASSTDNGATKPTVVQSKYGTSTPSGTSYSGLYFPVSKNNGKLSQLWLDLTESFSWSGNHNFTGTGAYTGTNTFSATTTMATTTSTGANFNNNIVVSFTAGETITGNTSPKPVYIATSTANVFVSDANVAIDKDFIGFAINNADASGTVYVQTDGVVKGFTGLTAGLEYYVQDDSTLGTSVGTAEIYVGRAISTTQILVDSHRADQYLGVSTEIAYNTIISVPLYTKTIIVELRIGAPSDWTNYNTAILKKNGILSSTVSGCDIGTGVCTSAPAISVTWNPTTSLLAGGGSGGDGTVKFYR